MKRSLLFVAFLLATTTGFSQEQKTLPHTKEFYLKKSKTQKKIANILIYTASAAVITGIVYPRGEKNDDTWCIYLCERYENSDIKGNFIAAGILLAIPSITLYLASSRNERKAERAVSLNFETRPINLPSVNPLARGRQPTLSLRIAL